PSARSAQNPPDMCQRSLGVVLPLHCAAQGSTLERVTAWRADRSVAWTAATVDVAGAQSADHRGRRGDAEFSGLMRLNPHATKLVVFGGAHGALTSPRASRSSRMSASV